MHYLFPFLGVHLTAIPKCGCTTTLTYLIAAERAAGSSDPAEFGNYLERMSGEQNVHDGTDRAAFIAERAPTDSSKILTVAVVRDPLDRLLSMWIDKAVLGQGPAFFKAYSSCDWFPRTSDTLALVRERFRRFLNLLGDEDFRNSNAHWAPQTRYLRPNPDSYDALLTLPQVSTLPALLAERRPGLEWLRSQSVPRLHRTPAALKLLFSDLARSHVDRLFAGDIAFLQVAGLRETGTALAQDHAEGFDESAWESLRQEMAINRIRARYWIRAQGS